MNPAWSKIVITIPIWTFDNYWLYHMKALPAVSAIIVQIFPCTCTKSLPTFLADYLFTLQTTLKKSYFISKSSVSFLFFVSSLGYWRTEHGRPLSRPRARCPPSTAATSAPQTVILTWWRCPTPKPPRLWVVPSVCSWTTGRILWRREDVAVLSRVS